MSKFYAVWHISYACFFHFDADPDPTYHFHADLDTYLVPVPFTFIRTQIPGPAPHQSDANLQPLNYTAQISTATFFEPPGLHCGSPQPSMTPF
jgi:hypothetical protein